MSNKAFFLNHVFNASANSQTDKAKQRIFFFGEVNILVSS